MPRRSKLKRRNRILKIYLRRDQILEDVEDQDFTDKNVIIFGPQWLRQGLQELRPYIPLNTVFKFCDKNGETDESSLLKPISLTELVIIARNKASSRSGRIRFSLYNGVIRKKSVIYAIKDLARQCIIIGTDLTTHYGGYNRCPRRRQETRVVLIDLIGLQFQRKYNTGRLVLIGNRVPKGFLDEFIFESVVGERKATLAEAKNDRTGRYIRFGSVLFDTLAYERFVEEDFLLVCLALHRTPGLNPMNLNLKFLKYGCGTTSGRYKTIVNRYISQGICRAMRRLLDSGFNQIKSFEFPFFKRNKELEDICAKHSVECHFTRNDALKNSKAGLTTATTNCANGHSVFGNRMRFLSVNATIAENLKTKANKFSPIINTKMKEKFISTNLRC